MVMAYHCYALVLCRNATPTCIIWANLENPTRFPNRLRRFGNRVGFSRHARRLIPSYLVLDPPTQNFCALKNDFFGLFLMAAPNRVIEVRRGHFRFGEGILGKARPF